jgi:hypothetical protein
MGSMAKGAIGLKRAAVRVGMANLNDPGKNKEGTAEEAERNPQRMTWFAIEEAARHTALL